MEKITFLVHEAEEGSYYANAANIGIFAEGDTLEELNENIKGGIECFFYMQKNIAYELTKPIQVNTG